ncbi:MAG: HD-GYP domain-containing protein [Clostridiaceae bacterium]
MRNNVLLLTNEAFLINNIKEYIDNENCYVNQVRIDSLMLDVYKLDAKILIIDLDGREASIISMVDSICFNDFLPIIYIYSNEISKLTKTMVGENILIEKSNLKYSLRSFIKSCLNFKAKYDLLNESYEAIDSVNSKTDDILRNCDSQDFIKYNKSMLELLEYVFATNRYLSNKPKFIITYIKNKNNILADIYYFTECGDLKKEVPLELSLDFLVVFDRLVENEFYYNSEEQELWDVDDYKLFFPKVVSNITGEINNFTGYVTSNIVVLAVNYNRKVTNFDAEVIKSLCINYNMMNNIYNQINTVQDSFIYTINALARAAEVNDDHTGFHIRRVNEFSRIIAEVLGAPKTFIKDIYYSAQMHDVGKIHISNDILCKPGKLTNEEFNMMKCHTTYGSMIIGNSPQLEMCSEIALNHHEKFDGTGYPNGRIGEKIPMSARIVTIADIYDALRSARPYKNGFTHEETYNIITKGDGRVMPSHFDSVVLDAFIKRNKEFQEIYEKIK